MQRSFHLWYHTVISVHSQGNSFCRTKRRHALHYPLEVMSQSYSTFPCLMFAHTSNWTRPSSINKTRRCDNLAKVLGGGSWDDAPVGVGRAGPTPENRPAPENPPAPKRQGLSWSRSRDASGQHEGPAWSGSSARWSSRALSDVCNSPTAAATVQGGAVPWAAGTATAALQDTADTATDTGYATAETNCGPWTAGTLSIRKVEFSTSWAAPC